MTASASPAMNGGTRYGTRASATEGLSSVERITTRGSSTTLAATVPTASGGASSHRSRLRRENCSDTAVDERIPPSAPVTPYPRDAPTSRRAM